MTEQTQMEILNSLALGRKASVIAEALGVDINNVNLLQETQADKISKLKIQWEEQQQNGN